MTWWKPKTWFNTTEKLNPAQEIIRYESGTNLGSDAKLTYLTSFDNLECVNRGVSMIANACASLDYDIKDKVHEGRVVTGLRNKQLNLLLNVRPNPYESVQEFRTKLFTDLLLEGNFFIYFDGAFLYHLPAINVVVEPDEKTFVKGYLYVRVPFKPEEIIHVKDLSSKSIYRGTSRLVAANKNISLLSSMQDFQKSFFENGAVPGMVIVTDNTLSQPAKDKTLLNWTTRYSPKSGAKRPMILDGGMKPFPLNDVNFKELDFAASIESHNIKILETLGVPPILLNGGNQANISPNLRLFYLETVMPIVRKYISAMELFSGYDIDAIVSNVSALQPDIKDIAAYHTTLVNGGVQTPNEARVELRYPKDTDPASDKLRIPANIAGSAANPSLGGAPKQPA